MTEDSRSSLQKPDKVEDTVNGKVLPANDNQRIYYEFN